jgi:hypothetical protein
MMQEYQKRTSCYMSAMHHLITGYRSTLLKVTQDMIDHVDYVCINAASDVSL